MRVTNIIESAVDIARRKFADAGQKNEHASAALIEVLATTKAIIDETKKRLPDTEAADLLAKLLTEEEAKSVRQNASDYAKRLVDDFNAARDEMHTRFIKAIAAEQNAD